MRQGCPGVTRGCICNRLLQLLFLDVCFCVCDEEVEVLL